MDTTDTTNYGEENKRPPWAAPQCEKLDTLRSTQNRTGAGKDGGSLGFTDS